MTIRELWATMPASERYGAIAFALIAPVIVALVCAVLP
jgi:hypothetical protein